MMSQLFMHSSPLSCRSAFDMSEKKNMNLGKKKKRKKKTTTEPLKRRVYKMEV